MMRNSWISSAVFLCATLAVAAPTGIGVTSPQQNEQRRNVMVEHVHVETAKPFGDVAAALQARMGKFDAAVYEQLQKGADTEVVRARLEKMIGPSGFMLFRTSDHGALLRLPGQKKKAIQYPLGNP